MKQKKIFTYLFFSLIFFISCDEIGNPLEENNEIIDTNIVFPINENPVKKVLLEEFTGHKCGNCPAAAKKLEELHQIYGEKLISLAIHTGDFAATDENFPEDYSTSEGDELNSFFGISSYPTALINRVEYNNNLVLPGVATFWEDALKEIIDKEQILEISIVNEFDSINRNLKTSVQIEFLKEFDDKLNLSIYLIENNIISPQDDYSLGDEHYVENYVHKHILRSTLNGTWGTELLESNLDNKKIVKTFLKENLNEKWNMENCVIIAFVYNTKTENKEVIQAEEKSIFELVF